ncbi:MAG: hypothetical protein JXA54_13520 [Candidatus Heimdallarchaeota archaeon]|nr:hypothetical protein [Candidatus Heimdallarchaeota archaeon]
MNQSEMEKELAEIEDEIEVDSLESRFNAFRREAKNQFLTVRILLLSSIIIGMIAIILLIWILRYVQLP